MKFLAILLIAASTAAVAQTVTIPAQSVTVNIPAQSVSVPTSTSSLPAGVTVSPSGQWTFKVAPIVPGLTMGTQPVVSTQGLAAGSYLVTVNASGAASYTPYVAPAGSGGATIPAQPTCTFWANWNGNSWSCESASAALSAILAAAQAAGYTVTK